MLVLVLGLAFNGCGKSSEQLERERLAHQASLEKVIADSLAEEREKDRLMREGASAQAAERIARAAAEHEQELAKIPLASARPTVEQQQADRAEALRKYSDKLKQAMQQPG